MAILSKLQGHGLEKNKVHGHESMMKKERERFGHMKVQSIQKRKKRNLDT